MLFVAKRGKNTSNTRMLRISRFVVETLMSDLDSDSWATSGSDFFLSWFLCFHCVVWQKPSCEMLFLPMSSDIFQSIGDTHRYADRPPIRPSWSSVKNLQFHGAKGIQASLPHRRGCTRNQDAWKRPGDPPAVSGITWKISPKKVTFGVKWPIFSLFPISLDTRNWSKLWGSNFRVTSDHSYILCMS